MHRGVMTLTAAVLLAGCASITRGTDEAVVFDSEPPGAEMRSEIVNICGEEKSCETIQDDRYATVADYSNKPGPTCVTPCTLQIKRNVELIATFTKPGYQSATLRVGRSVSGAGAAGFAGNVIAGGVTGMVVDGITGAGTDHVPNPAKVTLVPIASTAAPKGSKHGGQSSGQARR